MKQLKRAIINDAPAIQIEDYRIPTLVFKTGTAFITTDTKRIIINFVMTEVPTY